MKINLVLFALMVLSPFLAKSQKEDSLKNEKVYVDYTFGHIRSSTFLGTSYKTNGSKLFFGEKFETSFDLKNPHFGIGGQYLCYRKIDKTFFTVYQKYDAGLATLSYVPFLTKSFELVAGAGITSKKELASTYSLRYTIDSLFPGGSFTFEGNLTTLGSELDYNVVSYVMVYGYFIGGYYSNNNSYGVCFGAHAEWMLLKFVLWGEKSETKMYFPGSCQLDLTLPFPRKVSRLIYK